MCRSLLFDLRLLKDGCVASRAIYGHFLCSSVAIGITLTVPRIAFRQNLIFVAAYLKGDQLKSDRMLRTFKLAGNLFNCHATIPTITQPVLFVGFPRSTMFCWNLHYPVSLQKVGIMILPWDVHWSSPRAALLLLIKAITIMRGVLQWIISDRRLQCHGAFSTGFAAP